MFRLRVQANPGSSHRNMVWRGDHLKVNLTAPPVEGRANDELIEYLSDLLEISPGSIDIDRGETSRQKELLLHDVDRDHFIRTLQARKE